MTNKKDVKTIVVIGAGIMGRGIAHVSAVAGFTTVLNDISDELLEAAQTQIKKDLDKAVEIGKLTPGEKGETLDRLRLESGLERAVTGGDLIIEAIPENIALKLDLFARLDRLCVADAILASNTSAL